MITYQDFVARRGEGIQVVREVVEDYTSSETYRTALVADLYDRQKNKTINEYVKTIMTATGVAVTDMVSSNNKIASNFFARLNVQRCAYSLGNGITIAKDGAKQRLGEDFDEVLYAASYHALIHGVAYLFWNVDRAIHFPATQFAPIWDEDTGALAAGVRFWRLDADHPITYVLYEPDGVSQWREAGNVVTQLSDRAPYRVHIATTRALGDTVVGSSGYDGRLPVVPLYGSRLRQSTLVGVREAIDSYDLIRSGFANDLSDCTQIYWIIKNAGGMSEEDLNRFRQRLLRHVAVVNSEDGGGLDAHTSEIPYEARCRYLDDLRAGIFEDFGALDVKAISSANKTATAIQAAYEPMDQAADDFEMQIIAAVKQILAFTGPVDAECCPTFKRSRVSDLSAQVEMVLAEAEYLDAKTVLEKLPNITPEEVEVILARRDEEDLRRHGGGDDGGTEEEEDMA